MRKLSEMLPVSGRQARTIGALGTFLTLGLGAAVLLAAGTITVEQLSEDLDAADDKIRQCKTDLAHARARVRYVEQVQADLTRRTEAAEEIAKRNGIQAADQYTARTREAASAKALMAETERLRASIAALKAAAIETGSIGKVPPQKPARKRPKRRTAIPRAHVRDPHDWFWKAMQP